jgi:hypothetical protein
MWIGGHVFYSHRDQGNGGVHPRENSILERAAQVIAFAKVLSMLLYVFANLLCQFLRGSARWRQGRKRGEGGRGSDARGEKGRH